MQLVMTKKEIDSLKSHASNASSYFEYGCGGSTVLINSYPNIERMVSIDSCSEWIEKTKQQISDTSKISFYKI